MLGRRRSAGERSCWRLAITLTELEHRLADLDRSTTGQFIDDHTRPHPVCPDLRAGPSMHSAVPGETSIRRPARPPRAPPRPRRPHGWRVQWRAMLWRRKGSDSKKKPSNPSAGRQVWTHDPRPTDAILGVFPHWTCSLTIRARSGSTRTRSTPTGPIGQRPTIHRPRPTARTTRPSRHRPRLHRGRRDPWRPAASAGSPTVRCRLARPSRSAARAFARRARPRTRRHPQGHLHRTRPGPNQTRHDQRGRSGLARARAQEQRQVPGAQDSPPRDRRSDSRVTHRRRSRIEPGAPGLVGSEHATRERKARRPESLDPVARACGPRRLVAARAFEWVPVPPTIERGTDLQSELLWGRRVRDSHRVRPRPRPDSSRDDCRLESLLWVGAERIIATEVRARKDSTGT